MIARAQDEDAGPRLAIDRLGARSGMPLAVNSEAFAARDPIPGAYTAEGGNIAPPIFWSPGPRGTRSFVVIAEDEDARGGPHRLLWLVYDIPSEQTALGAGARLRVSRQRNGPVIARGKNSLGTVGYAGPRPTPAEGTHTYHFQVFALDTVLRAPDGASLPFVIGAMRGHVLAAGEIAGTFTASRPVRVADDTASKKPPPADEDLPEAPAKPEPIPEAPLKPEVKTAAAEAAPTMPPAPPMPSASVNTVAAAPPATAAPTIPAAQEKPAPLLAPQPPAPEQLAQVFPVQPPTKETAQIVASQRPPEPAKSAPALAAPQASAPAPASPARPSASSSPFDGLSALFSTRGNPQPMPVAVWVSAYGPMAAQAPTAPKPGPASKGASASPAEAPRSISTDAAPARDAAEAVALAEPAKARPVKPPEPDFVPSDFPPIELQPLPTDAWRIASERIGLPALPDLPTVREEPPPKVPETTVAVAPPPPSAPVLQPAKSESAQPLTAEKAVPSPTSKASAPASPTAGPSKVTRPPAETEPLPRMERTLVADLSFIRLPELPPVAAPIPPPDETVRDDAAGDAAPSVPPAPAPPAKLVVQPTTTMAAPEPAPETEKPAPAKTVKPVPAKPPTANASPPEPPAKPASLAPASAPPQTIAKPRPSIPSLRPSSGSKPNGAGG